MRISDWSSDVCSSDLTLNLVAADDDRPQLPAKAPADALAGAPTSYGDVPPLGAPLPGDLGRPILHHQRGLGMAPEESADEAARRAAQAAEAERQRIAAERSEEHTSELQSLMRTSYAVFCL